MSLFRWWQAVTGFFLAGRLHGHRAPRQGRSTRLLLESMVDRILPSFLPAVNYPVDVFPRQVVTGDVNGDGIPDLVALGRGSGTTSSVVVLLGNGDGTFLPGVSYPVAFNADTVAIGDFNGDGIPDLVIGSERFIGTGDDRLSVLLGNGDGSFQKPIETPVSVLPFFVAVADLNGDGRADLVVANAGQNQVSIFLGNGDGTFQEPVSYAAGSMAWSVAIADFNGDGIPDLAVVDEAGLGGTSGVSVLLGNGDGTFQEAVLYPTGRFPESVAVGDFNGDGTPDLVVTNSDGANYAVNVLLGVGDGTFQPAFQVASGIRGIAVAVADFNGDGIQDLAVTGFSGTGGDGSGVAVLLGNGDGTFQEPTRYDTDLSSVSVAVADFNGDGYPDLAVANQGPGNVSVLLNAADWSGPRTPVTRPSLTPITVGLPVLGNPVLARPVGCPVLENSPDGDDPNFVLTLRTATPLEFKAPALQTGGWAGEGNPLSIPLADHSLSLIKSPLAEPAPLGEDLFPV